MGGGGGGGGANNVITVFTCCTHLLLGDVLITWVRTYKQTALKHILLLNRYRKEHSGRVHANFIMHDAYSQGALVLAVFLQDGVPVLVGKGRLYHSEGHLTTSE